MYEAKLKYRLVKELQVSGQAGKMQLYWMYPRECVSAGSALWHCFPEFLKYS
jgi:hypothetical protein